MKIKKPTLPKVKMNMVVGKRQIVLAALVMGLGCAVYLNWEYTKMDTNIDTAVAETGKNYGDAQFVSSEEEDAYFAEAKLSRTKSRDEAAEALSEMLADAELEADQKAELAMKAAELAQSIEIEGKMENLIQAKGFDECMVYYDTDRVDIVVKTDGLTDDEVMQMRDIAIRETSVPGGEHLHCGDQQLNPGYRRRRAFSVCFFIKIHVPATSLTHLFLYYRLRNTKNMV